MDIYLRAGDCGHGIFHHTANLLLIYRQFMKLLRRYQLDIIFLFFALIVIVGLFFYLLRWLGADSHDYEWLVVLPLLLIYFFYLLSVRNKININDRRQLTGKSLIYWLMLGMTIVLEYQTPIGARDYWSVNLFFLIFTILLADSYWDFRNINLKNLTIYKNKWDKV